MKILCLHGQPGAGADFAGVCRWVDPTVEVVAPDRPGWGANPMEPTTISGNAEWALAQVGHARSVVVGHSFGAAIAVRMAELAPPHVAGLVLVAPAVSMRAILAIDRLLGVRILGQVGATVIMGSRLGRGPVDALPRGRRSFLVEQKHLLHELGLVERALGVIDVPVAVVAGLRDRVVPAGAVLDAIDRVRHGSVDLVLDGGHDLVRTHPWRVASAVARSARGL